MGRKFDPIIEKRVADILARTELETGKGSMTEFDKEMLRRVHYGEITQGKALQKLAEYHAKRSKDQ